MLDLVMTPPDELVELLSSRDPNERRMAIYELEKTKDKRYASNVANLLDDPNMYVRMAVVRALGEFNDPGTAEGLINALDDEYYMVVQNALWSLGKLGAAAEKAMPLIEAMKDNDTSYRERQLSVSEVAELVYSMIEIEVEKKREAEEAAKAKKAAQQQQQQATAAAPSEAAPVEEAPIVREENRPDKRTETLQRKRARAEQAGVDADWIPSQ